MFRFLLFIGVAICQTNVTRIKCVMLFGFNSLYFVCFDSRSPKTRALVTPGAFVNASVLASDVMSSYISSHEPLQLPDQKIPILFSDLVLSDLVLTDFSFDQFDVSIVDSVGIKIALYERHCVFIFSRRLFICVIMFRCGRDAAKTSLEISVSRQRICYRCRASPSFRPAPPSRLASRKARRRPCRALPSLPSRSNSHHYVTKPTTCI